MVAAPSVSSNIWDMSNYIMDQVGSLLKKVNYKHQPHTVSCQLAITEYGGSKCLIHFMLSTLLTN